MGIWSDHFWRLPSANITPSQWQVCFGCRRTLYHVERTMQRTTVILLWSHKVSTLWASIIVFFYCVQKPMHIHTNLWFPIYCSSTITVLHFTAVTLLKGYKHTHSIHMFLFGDYLSIYLWEKMTSRLHSVYKSYVTLSSYVKTCAQSCF